MDSSESLMTSTNTSSGRSGNLSTKFLRTHLTTSSTNFVLECALMMTCPSSGLFRSSNVGDEKELSTMSMSSSASTAISSGMYTMMVQTFLWLCVITGCSLLISSISVTVCWPHGHAVIPVTSTPTILVSSPPRSMWPPASSV